MQADPAQPILTGSAPGRPNAEPEFNLAAKELFPTAHLPVGENSEAAAEIAARHKLNPLIARVLVARNFSRGQALARYLSPDLESELLRAGLPIGMDRAIDLVVSAVNSKHKVAICCDYDVDGTSSAAIMGRFIRALGGKAVFFTPDRVDEGYGLNRRIVDAASRAGCKTLITLDCGTSNHAELAVAHAHGLTTVVIDHHHIQRGIRPPMCDAFVNPQNKGCGFASGSLCTAGLMYVLVARYVQRHGSIPDLDMRTLQGLAALGTVADVVPLKGINRALVRSGLVALADGKVEGVTHLAEQARIDKISSASDIGYVLGPRINAVGRVGHRRADGNGAALSAVELLCSDGPSRCHTLARDLDSINRIRRELERLGVEIAVDQLRSKPTGSTMVVASPKIHEGVAGIVAARLVDRFNRPAVVLCQRSDGTMRGSARNVRSMTPHTKNARPLHLAKLLAKLGVKSGGHAGAAGLSLQSDQLQEFSRKFDYNCQRLLEQFDTKPNITSDTVVSVRELRELDSSFWDQLDLIEPCDQNVNPGVSFGLRSVCVVGLESIGSHHSRVILRQSDALGDSYIALHLWHRTPGSEMQPGQYLDIVCRPLKRSRLKNSLQQRQDNASGFELVAASASCLSLDSSSVT